MVIYTKHKFISEPAEAYKYTTINVEKYKSIKLQKYKRYRNHHINITLYLNSFEFFYFKSYIDRSW